LQDTFDKKYNISDKKHILYLTRKLNVFSQRSSLNINLQISKKPLRIIVEALRSILFYLISNKRKNVIISNLEKIIELYVGDMYKESNKEISKLIKIDLKKYGYKK